MEYSRELTFNNRFNDDYGFSYIGDYMRDKNIELVEIQAQEGCIFDAIKIDRYGHFLGCNVKELQQYEYICVPVFYGSGHKEEFWSSINDVNNPYVYLYTSDGNYTPSPNDNWYDYYYETSAGADSYWYKNKYCNNTINNPSFRNSLLNKIKESLLNNDVNIIQNLTVNNNQSFSDFNNNYKKINIKAIELENPEWETIYNIVHNSNSMQFVGSSRSTIGYESGSKHNLLIIYNRILGDQDVYIKENDSYRKIESVYLSKGDDKQIEIINNINGYGIGANTIFKVQGTFNNYELYQEQFIKYDFNIDEGYTIISVHDPSINFGNISEVYIKRSDTQIPLIIIKDTNNVTIRNNVNFNNGNSLIIKADILDENGGTLTWDYTQGTNNTESFKFNNSGLSDNRIRITPMKLEPSYPEDKLNLGMNSIEINGGAYIGLQNNIVALTGNYEASGWVEDWEDSYNILNKEDFNSPYVIEENNNIIYTYSSNLIANYPGAQSKSINITFRNENIGIEHNGQIYYPFIKENVVENEGTYLWYVNDDLLPDGILYDDNEIITDLFEGGSIYLIGKTIYLKNNTNHDIVIPPETFTLDILKDLNDQNSWLCANVSYNEEFTIPGGIG